MRHILHRLLLRKPFALELVPDAATYQTNRNHVQHSKFDLLRLTLVTLWNLRVPLMVRIVLIVLFVVPFLASSAGASRIDARLSAHASISKSTVHRVHRPAHAVSRSSKTTAHGTRSVDRRSPSRSASARSTRYSSASRHSTYSPRSRASLRRTRYGGGHARAHFVPLATVPVSQNDSRSRLESAAETANSEPEAEPAQPTAEDEHAPSSESHAGLGHPVPAETDTAPAPSADASTAGNPLAAPPVAAAAPATSGQVAELHLPRFPVDSHVSSYTLRGTHDSLVRQNERSDEEALERIQDDADLHDRIARGFLVRVPESSALTVNQDLPEDRRYCRPWTANFLTTLSRAHQAQFHTPLVVSSAVRTVEYQKRLMRINHNAADAEGDIVSPHVTGATIDIAKSGLSRREMEWMRSELLAFQNAGVIDVEEEFHQRCFHITVYKNYDSVSQPHRPARDAATPAAPASLPAGPGDAVAKDE